MSRALLAWLAVLTLLACSKKESAPEEPSSIPRATPSPTGSAPPTPLSLFPKQPLPNVPILPGKGIGAVVLGATLIMVERELGPCTNFLESGLSRTCLYPHRGLDVGLRDNKIVRVGLYRDGRKAPGKEAPVRFRGFVGETPDGVRIAMSGRDVEQKIGKPTKRLRPTGDTENTDDGHKRLEIWEYTDKGFALDMENTRDGLVVGALQIPKLDGKSWDGEKK